MIVINNPYRYICVQRLAFKGGGSFSTARIYKIDQQDIHCNNPCYDGSQSTITKQSSKKNIEILRVYKSGCLSHKKGKRIS